MKYHLKDIVVKYRYVITMSDAYKTMDKVIENWTTTKFDRIYSGKLMLLVSPIFFVRNSKDLLVQLQLDIENKSNNQYEVFRQCIEFTKKHKHTYITYTGRNGFHIYSSYLIHIPNGLDIPIKYLRQGILSLYDTSMFGNNLDKVASIRNMPTIRIGMRDDTRKLAFPILSDNYEKFRSLQDSKDFSRIMSKKDLKSFISNKLLPHKVVRLKKSI